jgi:hypothetical protein
VHARELEQAAGDLRRLRRRAVDAGMLLAATAAAAAIALLVAPALAGPISAGAALEALLLALALHGYRERIARLALDPSAYALPEVKRYGHRLVEPRQRARLGAWILEILADAHRSGNLFLGERVARFAQELEEIASDLMRPGASVQPASAVACKRLLTHAVESPLYNPRLPSDELRIALRRIRAGISPV